MIYYHLHDKGNGLELGFLGIAKSFDEADTLAAKLLEKGETNASVWILDEPGVQTLLSSIHKECPALLPIGVDVSKPQVRLNENFVREKAKVAQGMTMMGESLASLDWESLLATAVCMAEMIETERQHHRQSMELLDQIRRIKSKG